MKIHFFNDAPHTPFILFCSGFGILPQALNPKKPLAMVYDYRDFSNADEICALAQNAHTLIAWSMGVAFASRILYTPTYTPTKVIAINGTPLGIDRQYGIHPKLFRRTIQYFDRKSFIQGCFGESSNDSYLSPTHILQEELQSLESFCAHTPLAHQSKWHEAYISQKDMIFSPTAQNLAWETYAKTHPSFSMHTLTSPHFVFDTLEIL